MSLEIWIAYTIAATILLIIPGPTVILVISYSMTYGKKAAIPLVAGVTLGDFVAMTCSLLGLGAILATSSVLFAVFKWAGVVYLLYLGIRLWRSNPHIESVTSSTESAPRALFTKSFTVTALNPKGIAFFVAFLPQFLDPQYPTNPQLIIMGGTFLVIASLNAALYAIFAGSLRDAIRSYQTRKLLNRCGGGTLCGLGILTATMQRSS